MICLFCAFLICLWASQEQCYCVNCSPFTLWHLKFDANNILCSSRHISYFIGQGKCAHSFQKINNILNGIKAEQVAALLLTTLYGCTRNDCYRVQASNIVNRWKEEKAPKHNKRIIIMFFKKYKNLHFPYQREVFLTQQRNR